MLTSLRPLALLLYTTLILCTSSTALAQIRAIEPQDGAIPTTSTGMSTVAIGDVVSTESGVLDLFHGGDAAAVNKDGIYNVIGTDGYVWVGYGSSNSSSASKFVAMRMSDGGLGAFDTNGHFYIPTTSASSPDAGYFTVLSENTIMYAVPQGVAALYGDVQGEHPRYAYVTPGVKADKSVTIKATDGHGRAGAALGDTVIVQIEKDAGINLRRSLDAGATWADAATSVVAPSASYTRTRFHVYQGRLHVFEEWRPGDEGQEADEKAIMRFEPGEPEEFVVLFDNHSALAPWSHYTVEETISIPGIGVVDVQQDMYPGVESLVEADGVVYVGLASGRIGKTPDLSTALTEIVNPVETTDDYGNPRVDVFYFGHANDLYAYVGADDAVYRYDPLGLGGAGTWTKSHDLELSWVPHRFHYDQRTGILSFASARGAGGHVGAAKLF